MDKHRYIKRMKAINKRREKGKKRFAGSQPSANEPRICPKMHPFCQFLRWRFAFRERTANLLKSGSLDVSPQRTNSKPANKNETLRFTLFPLKIQGLKRAKQRELAFFTTWAYWGALWCARAWILVKIELGFEVLMKKFGLHILVLLLHSPSLTFVQCL